MLLSAQNRNQLWVPEGFAHGFFVTSGHAEVVYKVTDYYAPEWERSILWNDPQIGVEWPLAGMEPILSSKDLNGKPLADAEIFEEK
jgi:dTDP-4-dehydrorhamnose 3,5-epimerase